MNIIGKWAPTHVNYYTEDGFVKKSKEEIEKLGEMEDYQQIFNSILEFNEDLTCRTLVKISPEDLKELMESDEADEYEIVDGMVVVESGRWKQDGDNFFMCGVDEAEDGTMMDEPFEVANDYIEYMGTCYARI